MEQNQNNPTPPRNVFIATPSYDNTVGWDYVHSLISSQGIWGGFAVVAWESLVPRARNQLAHQFLDYCAERPHIDCMVMIDGDILWTPEQLALLISGPQEIVAGCYRKKRMGPPEWVLDSEHVAKGQDELPQEVFECDRVGTGFLKISRVALERIWPLAQEITQSRLKYRDVFPVLVDEQGEYLSEDYGFCRLAKQAGLRVYSDGRIRLGHRGSHVYA